MSDPTQFVRSLWTGAVDHCSVTASVVTSGVVAPMRLVAATTPDFIDPRYSKVILPDPEYFCCRGSIEALSPATAYYLGVELHGRIDDSKVGRFRTAAAGAHSFRFAAASCATTGSNAAVFDNITTADPDFFVHLGDMHYEDIDEDDEALFHEAYNEVFDARRQNRCWREIPMYYIWDDHDFIKKNDDRQSVSGCEAAVAAYRRRVPSPPLATKGACDPVHYAFVRGRVRFVISDLRSARTPSKQPDDERKSMLGGAQLAWLSRQFADARAAGEAVIWASTVPWIAGCSESKDSWGDSALKGPESWRCCGKRECSTPLRSYRGTCTRLPSTTAPIRPERCPSCKQRRSTKKTPRRAVRTRSGPLPPRNHSTG